MECCTVCKSAGIEMLRYKFLADCPIMLSTPAVSIEGYTQPVEHHLPSAEHFYARDYDINLSDVSQQ